MSQTDVCADAPLEGYAFAYLDETTKRMIRRGLLKAVAIPGYQVPFASREMPMPCGWGTGGIQITASILGRDDVLKVIDQGSDDTTNAVSIRDFFRKTTGVATTTHTDEATIIQTRHRIPEQPLTESQIMVYQVPLPEPLRWLEPSEQETRTLHALEEYGIMNVKLYEDIVHHGTIATGFDYPVRVAGRYIMSPSPIPRFDNPKMHQCPALQLFGAGREKRLYAIPPYTDVESLDFEDYPFTVQSSGRSLRHLRLHGHLSGRSHPRRSGEPHVRMFRYRLLRPPRRLAGRAGRRAMKDWNAAPILSARNLTRRYGEHIGCRDVSFDLWPGEVLGIVGESGSGKSTLLNMLSGRMEPTSGTIAYRDAAGRERNIHALPEGEKRRLLRSELGFVHQRPSDGLRMQVSAGANIGERLMAEGARHYGTLRGRALQWLERVEIDAGRIDDKPALYSGGMQQRLQIARNLVTSPRLVFMDEPTGGLDVSVQARLLDLSAPSRAGHGSGGHPRHPRSRRGPPALAPAHGHVPGGGRGNGAHRSGARRSASRLHATPRLFHPARVSHEHSHH